MDRTHRIWTILLAAALAWISLIASGAVRAANSLPVSGAWNITSSGKAGSSGELLFRVTADEDTDPVEVTVFILSGSNETGVASSIRRALSAQLDNNRYDVASGEGANVLLSQSRGKGGFSLELIDSDVENIRVVVQSAAPALPPTVPPQQTPANPQVPDKTPPEPGNATPPAESAPPTPAPTQEPAPGTPSAPPAATPSAPPATPSAPGETTPANGGAGAPASAPPPPPGDPSN